MFINLGIEVVRLLSMSCLVFLVFIILQLVLQVRWPEKLNADDTHI